MCMWLNSGQPPDKLRSPLSVTIRSWGKVYFPCSSSRQSTWHNINTWQWRSPLWIPAAVRLINRSEDKPALSSQKFKSNLWAVLPLCQSRILCDSECLSHQKVSLSPPVDGFPLSCSMFPNPIQTSHRWLIIVSLSHTPWELVLFY